MLVPDRQRTILRLLSDRGRLTLAEIQSRLGISAATARRDASQLSAAGLARRTHGGLLPPDFSLSEPAYSRKAEKATGIKVRLGRAVAELLPEDGSIFIDAGTTCLEVGRALLDRPHLRIFTNSVSLLAGGEVRKISLALTGALAQGWLEQLRFDVAVIGASGLDQESGVFTTELNEASVKVEALRRTRLRILVAHGEKWARPSAVQFARWTAFHHLVTDTAPMRNERAALDSAKVKVHVVSQR
ncbi:MAG: DeoR/GlpR transcriptional regulator [Opitutae bacterium]|nr:DeoR/GlpR transcriptional regulator [Opitutae bacterium]